MLPSALDARKQKHASVELVSEEAMSID